MFSSLGSTQRIGDSDPIKFYERRVVVRGGSINTVPLCALSNPEIVRLWIPNSIIILKWNRSIDPVDFEKEPEPRISTVLGIKIDSSDDS
jgi:hypothetical protein